MLRRPEIPKIARIDMTPMAGVLICLLIIFMVVTPMGCSCIDVELPRWSLDAAKEFPDQPDSIIVGLTRGGSLFFRGVKLDNDIAELSERLRDTLNEEPDVKRRVYLKADIAARYSDVSRVVETCRRAGIRDVVLIVEPKLDERDWLAILRG